MRFRAWASGLLWSWLGWLTLEGLHGLGLLRLGGEGWLRVEGQTPNLGRVYTR